MGKFDGCLICTDLDDTLLTTDRKISQENIDAIEYFKSEGGLFTFATGRVLQSVRSYIDIVKPNAPVITYNGGAIYDWQNDEFLYKAVLDKDAVDVINFVMSECEFTAVEIVTADKMYICRDNPRMIEHMSIEGAEYIYAKPEDTSYPWMKIILIQEREEVEKLRAVLDNSEYFAKYHFTQSSPNYYEILPKNASKGTAGLKLCEILGIDRQKFFAIGDNENDIEMISYAAFGAAVKNASDNVKSYADAVAPHHNEHAIAWLINEIEKKVKE